MSRSDWGRLFSYMNGRKNGAMRQPYNHQQKKATRRPPPCSRSSVGLLLWLVGERAITDTVGIVDTADGNGAAGALVIIAVVFANAVGGRTGAAALGGGYLSAGDANRAAAAGACIGAIMIDSRASSNTRTSIISIICPTIII